MLKTEYWSYSTKDKSYKITESAAMSVFPTIVNPQKKIVYCRKCGRWEYIAHFANDRLLSQCGNIYEGPFVLENDVFNYGYRVEHHKDAYVIKVQSQTAKTHNRRLLENEFIINIDKKMIIKNGKPAFELDTEGDSLCKEITDEVLSTIGDKYKKLYGIKPTVSSKLSSFSVILGYLVSPFNVNFFRISHHWGLNPYSKDFASLSSGDTPTAENEMFDSLGIKPNKTVRKMYQRTPEAIICYSAAKYLGFNDPNILTQICSPLFYSFLCMNMISFAGGDISFAGGSELKDFVHDMIALSNEKTVMNSIERMLKYYKKSPERNAQIIDDAINSYEVCREHLTEREKREIMSEGFNNYVHDYLVRRVHEIEDDFLEFKGKKEENITFEIEKQFLDLEYKAGDPKIKVTNPHTGKVEIVDNPDENRYCFYVARDSGTLRKIGNAMHNCVGWGYKNSVKARRCTIVYALHHNKHKICIEVSPDFSIRQALGPCNCPLTGEVLAAYWEWCKEKGIVFRKAFVIRCAP